MSDLAAERLLRVDLSAERVVSEPVPATWRRRYLGGKGLGARYLYEELDPGVDPLGPANALLVLLGPLTGALPGGPRYAAVTKSPLTGAFLDSYAGGRFPGVLAGALGDHLGLLVTGRADAPVRLVVADGNARLEPAETWGADAVETARAFPDASVACIGPAGEHRVAYATIASDEAEHHAGRGGAGAVMGAKRLKAVVARGDPPTPDGELATLRDRAAADHTGSDTGRWLDASGTLESVDFADATGVLAARGWRDRGFEGAEDVGVEAARAAAVDREQEGARPGGFRVDTDAGESVPRGATAMSLGAGLGIDEFDAVAELGERCNRLGLDLISAGNAVAWAIRAAEAGVLDPDRALPSERDLASAQDLAFGDPEGAASLLSAIATRETALADALADGVAAAADRLGGTDLVPTVKSMSLPAYDPRGAASMALAYATSDRGGCHRRARPVEREVFERAWTPRRAAEAVVAAQDARALRWSLVADDFVGESLVVAPWLDAAGVPYGDLDRTAERIWTLVRLFNVREGFDRGDDALPPALAGEDGVPVERFEAMLDAYYATRGWSPDGLPTAATLDRLDLADAVDDRTPVPSGASPEP